MDEQNQNNQNQTNQNSDSFDCNHEYKNNFCDDSVSLENTSTDSIPSVNEEEKEALIENSNDSLQQSTPNDISAPKVVYRWDYQKQYNADNEKEKTNKKNGKFVYATVFVSIFLVTICVLIGTVFLGAFSKANGEFREMSASIGDLYEECLPSYVAIQIDTGVTTGIGSGFIIRSDGYIATNYHVVEDAKDITIILNDGTKYPATYLDGDELNDIAVLKVDAKDLPTAKLGSSKNSRVGDRVMAIGTPHSINYSGTMTSGYISALNRRYVEQNENGTINKVLYLIQTDTTLNPGNSGGPLFNMNGEVIGIVTLKISGGIYEGLGFALPMESVLDIINDIIQNGKITNSDAGGATHGAALGITGFATIENTKYLISGNYHYQVIQDPDTSEEVVIIPTLYGNISIPLSDKDSLALHDITEYEFFVEKATGICVVSTSEGFDASQKLKINDILISADGIECQQIADLQFLIADKKVGDSITFKVYRNGIIKSISVELGKSSNMN